MAPFVGIDKAGCAFPCKRLAVSNTESCVPFSVASTRALSPEAKVICVGRAGRGIVARGWKGLVLTFSSPVGAEIAVLMSLEEAI